MNKRIIIIGGMGPQASLELHKRILDKASSSGATNGHDYPEIAHLSIPVRDFISGKDNLDVAFSRIASAMSRLYLWLRRSNTFSLQHSAFI
ncbi:MAG: hypothetical protein ACREGF_02530, partial [Candidatus Saccharimonadales bacterium]